MVKVSIYIVSINDIKESDMVRLQHIEIFVLTYNRGNNIWWLFVKSM